MTPAKTQPAPPPLPQGNDATGDPNLINRITYQLFMILVTLMTLAVTALYYLAPLPEQVNEVLYFVNDIGALILLFDFGVHVVKAPDRLRYMAPLGLFDLVGSLPGAPYLRLLRLPSLVITWRDLRRNKSGGLVDVARSRLAESTLLTGVALVFLMATVGGMALVWIEAPVEGSNIKTGEDALWYALVTISTVGYGDKSPITTSGRIIGSALILVGVGIFSVLTGFISTKFLARRKTTGASDIDLLRLEMTRRLEQQAATAAEDRAALEARFAALEARIAALSEQLLRQ